MTVKLSGERAGEAVFPVSVSTRPSAGTLSLDVRRGCESSRARGLHARGLSILDVNLYGSQMQARARERKGVLGGEGGRLCVYGASKNIYRGGDHWVWWVFG